jgi:predicted nucleic acid-binding protein
MVVVDTSSLVAYLEGENGFDVDAVAAALEAGAVVLPPVVVTELFSDPALDARVRKRLLDFPILELKENYWVRSGDLRAKILKKQHKARLADALIAQSCLDHNLALITRDADFRRFAKHCDLKLVVDPN